MNIEKHYQTKDGKALDQLEQRYDFLPASQSDPLKGLDFICLKETRYLARLRHQKMLPLHAENLLQAYRNYAVACRNYSD